MDGDAASRCTPVGSRVAVVGEGSGATGTGGRQAAEPSTRAEQAASPERLRIMSGLGMEKNNLRRQGGSIVILA